MTNTAEAARRSAPIADDWREAKKTWLEVDDQLLFLDLEVEGRTRDGARRRDPWLDCLNEIK